MPIEGVIAEVLETFPLQLTLDADGRRRRVVLRPDTTVRSRLRVVDAGRLRPGQTVRIEAEEAAGGPPAARVIDILAEPAAAPPPAGRSASADDTEVEAGTETDAEYPPSAPAPLPPADES